MSSFSSPDPCWTECAICHRAIERVGDSTGAPLELRKQDALHFFHAHKSCAIARDDARRVRETLDLMRENGSLRRRVTELETQLAATPSHRTIDPHDPDGGEDDVHCPNGGRLIRGH
ncbi:MAG: hypothetical protein Q7S02_05330 [bacterium]|nr:hypothetical protein [bacterium]